MLYPTLPPSLKHRLMDPCGLISTPSAHTAISRSALKKCESLLSAPSPEGGLLADLYSYQDSLEKAPGNLTLLNFFKIRIDGDGASDFSHFTEANIRMGNGTINLPSCSVRTLAVKTIGMCGGDPSRVKNSRTFCRLIMYMAERSLVAVVRTSSTTLAILAPCLDAGQANDNDALDKGGYHAVLYSAKAWDVLVNSVCPEATEAEAEAEGTGRKEEDARGGECESEMEVEGSSPTLWLPEELETVNGHGGDNGSKGLEKNYTKPAWMTPSPFNSSKYSLVLSPVPTDELWLPLELDVLEDDAGEASSDDEMVIDNVQDSARPDLMLLGNAAGAAQSGQSNRSSSAPTFSNSQAIDTDRFYSSVVRDLESRADSYLYHMRNFNNWVKAKLIALARPVRKVTASSSRAALTIDVLDLACGKGGDLMKWALHQPSVRRYVGVDVARGSLRAAAARCVKNRQIKALPSVTFVAADLGEDVLGAGKGLESWKKSRHLKEARETGNEEVKFEIEAGGGVPKDKFDVVSIQFAVHYMMQTRARARRFFKTVGDLLGMGGVIVLTTVDARVVAEEIMKLGKTKCGEEGVTIEVGGGLCKLKFQKETIDRMFGGQLGDNWYGLQYNFLLLDTKDGDRGQGVGEAVDLPEWLVPGKEVELLAAEAGLELVEHLNFHEFYGKYGVVDKRPDNLLYTMNVLDINGGMSQNEWDISRIYCTMKFQKVRQSAFDDSEFDDVDDKPTPSTKKKEKKVKEKKDDLDLTEMEMLKGVLRLRKMGLDVNSMTQEDQREKILGFKMEEIQKAKLAGCKACNRDPNTAGRGRPPKHTCGLFDN